MLGALAKTFGGRGNGSALSVDEEVEQLLSRVSESNIPEERTEALSQLRDIAFDSVEAQLALGNMGIPVLVSILRDEANDSALLRGAVECLHVSMAQAPKARKQETQATPAHAINAGLFTRSKEHVSLLLALFDTPEPPAAPRDFYVRYHAVKTLAALVHAAPFRLQEVVVAESRRVCQLVALLEDEEVLRNETLLLLSAVAANNADLQQLMAFQGALERAWLVAESEGGCEGGGAVQDALELCCSLTLCNAKTQRMFREVGLVPKLGAMLRKTLPSAAADNLSRQQQLNLMTALMQAQILLAPLPEPSHADNVTAVQGLLLTDGLLDPLVITGISRATQGPVRAAVLHTVTKMVTGNAACRDKLASLTVTAPVGQIPIIQAVLRVSLYGTEGYGRTAAREVLRGFCTGNAEGQLALVSTMVPLGDDADASSFGSELVKALMSPDLDVSSRAAGVTSLLLDGNPDAKQRALTIPLSVHAAPGNFLMPRCMTYLQAVLSAQGDRPGLALAAPDILCMLVVWTHDCQPAITALLGAAAHVPCLLDVVAGRLGAPHPLTQGLASLLLGACVLYGAPHDAEAVRAAVGQRVGASELLARLAAMREDPLWAQGGAPPSMRRADEDASEAAGTPPNPISPPFVALVDSFEAPLQQALLVAGSLPTHVLTHAPAHVPAYIPQAPTSHAAPALPVAAPVASNAAAADSVAVASLRREVEELRIRNAAMAQDLARATTGAPSGSPASTAVLASVQAKVEDLTAQLASVTAQRDELQGEVGRLRQQLVGCREEVQLARGEADKYAHDLEDLSAAYNQLEVHSLQVEAQLRDAGGGGDVARLVEQAREEARAEAEAEQEDGMNDLLVCLGQEEAKAERLRARLEELGEDVDALLEGVMGAEEE